jgi:hypothetical protein
MSDISFSPGGPPLPPPDTLHPTAEVALIPGTPVYTPSGGNVNLARSNALGTTQCTGLVVLEAEAGDHAVVRYGGPLQLTVAQWTAVLDTGTSLTPGAPYYVDGATAGKITKTKPVSNYIAQVGLAIGPVTMLIQRSQPRVVAS